MLDLYTHPQSHPCRAVTMLLDILDVKYNYHFTDLANGEQNKPEFLALNPQHNVPFIIDGKFSLNESGAILMYLAEKYGGKNNTLYPLNNIETRARINQRIFFGGATLHYRFREGYVRINAVAKLTIIPEMGTGLV